MQVAARRRGGVKPSKNRARVIIVREKLIKFGQTTFVQFISNEFSAIRRDAQVSTPGRKFSVCQITSETSFGVAALYAQVTLKLKNCRAKYRVDSAAHFWHRNFKANISIWDTKPHNAKFANYTANVFVARSRL